MNRRPCDSSLFLKKSRDYARVKLRGARLKNPLFNIIFCENQASSSRIGIVVGRRFGKAVFRNRAKRIFRELVRAVQGDLVNGYDIVIFPKPLILDQQFQIIQENWKVALHKIGVIRPCPQPSCPESFSG